VQPLPVVERLDPLEECTSRFVSGLEIVIPDEFIFKAREEALGASVVVAVALAAHARKHAVGLEDCPVSGARVHDALVGVVDKAGSRLPSFDRHHQGVRGELPVVALTHGPTDDPARVEIEQHSQVEPAFAGRDKGDIAHPHPVRDAHGELSIQQIRGRGLAVASGIGEPKAAPTAGFDAVKPSQPCHPVVAATDTLVCECAPGFHDPIGLAGTDMDLANAREQAPVPLHTTALGPVLPAVIAAPGHL